MTTVEQALCHFRELIESAVTTGGEKAKKAMICSSRPIMHLHEAVKSALVETGVGRERICPPLGQRKPELKLAGSMKQKDQDICAVPCGVKPEREILRNGLLEGVEDIYGEAFTRQTLVVNVRSQISSIQKNFDTLYERTLSEALNLHDRCPDMVLGEVYLIAAPEYDDEAFKRRQCAFKKANPKLVEKYIKSFKALSAQRGMARFSYQYEAVCLLIADFSRPVPKLYHTTEELAADGLLPPGSPVRYEGLGWQGFCTRLLEVYRERFGCGSRI